MNQNLLFAIDEATNEIIVSESPKGSNKINLVERISRKENELLYHAVLTLTLVTKDSNFDPAIFKAMDKVCQLIYGRKI
ncbi:MAG: hypothetical protein ACK492_11320 [Chitinophagaceae bacterium]|jgi:hypothetical protein